MSMQEFKGSSNVRDFLQLWYKWYGRSRENSCKNRQSITLKEMFSVHVYLQQNPPTTVSIGIELLKLYL